MSGCMTCGGYGNRHDPMAHGDAAREWRPCPDCGFMCADNEWSCWRCGAVQPDGEDER